MSTCICSSPHVKISALCRIMLYIHVIYHVCVRSFASSGGCSQVLDHISITNSVDSLDQILSR